MANKKWYQSKTIWINGLAIVGGVATALSADIASGVVLSAGGIINTILRVVTKAELK